MLIVWKEVNFPDCPLTARKDARNVLPYLVFRRRWPVGIYYSHFIGKKIKGPEVNLLKVPRRMGGVR